MAKRSGKSPTQRSLQFGRDAGYTCEIVERWNPHVRRRQDLLGFADLLFVGNGAIVAVQTTSGGDVSKRIAKIEACENARTWLANGGKIEVHGWRKVGPRGKRKTWQIRRVFVTLCGVSGAIVTEEANNV